MSSRIPKQLPTPALGGMVIVDRRDAHVRVAGLLIVCAATACVTASGAPEALGSPAVTRQPDGLCQVLIQNSTSQALEINYQTGTRRVDVGISEPGGTHTVAVPCKSTRFWVQGSSIAAEDTGRDQYRKGAQLTQGEEVLVKLTLADRIRR